MKTCVRRYLLPIELLRELDRMFLISSLAYQIFDTDMLLLVQIFGIVLFLFLRYFLVP